jgi:predicted TIM-barrel fold metal-dependent hydrolase
MNVDRPMIVDTQVHVYENGRHALTTSFAHTGPPEFSGATLASLMDEAGVDGAIINAPLVLYGDDATYAIALARADRSRFAVMALVDDRRTDATDVIDAWADQEPTVVALRVAIPDDVAAERIIAGSCDQVARAAAAHTMPVCVAGGPRVLPVVQALAKAHRNTRFVLDHIGLYPRAAGVDAFSPMQDVVKLATFDNVAVKATCLPSLSDQAYPFEDLWPPLLEVLRAFGAERTMWGTDWTRASDRSSYADAANWLLDGGRLSAAELMLVMGESACDVFGWRPVRPSFEA